MTRTDLQEIEQKLQYEFKNKKLLTQAFTHSSFANLENVEDNERMEFLGDAILDEIVSERIYQQHSKYSAGDLSKMRSNIVSADALRPVVLDMDLLRYLQVANKKEKLEQYSKKIESNLYEAVLCAIYLDGGYAAARDFVLRTLSDNFKEPLALVKKDHKTALQEYCQPRKKAVKYTLTEKSGPDNQPVFKVDLVVDGKVEARGEGRSKKAAEQCAAEKLLSKWRIN